MSTSLKRAVRLEWRTAAELNEHPDNWKHHPQEQLDALESLLDRVGWAGVVLFNERTQRLLDGHGRRLLMFKRPDEELPVLIGNWTDEQERLILAALDPIAGMAEADSVKLAELLKQIETVDPDLDALFAKLADDNGLYRETETQQASEELEAIADAEATAERDEETLLDQAIQLRPSREYVVVMCDELGEFEQLKVALGLKPVRRGGYRAGSQFDAIGTQRVVKASDLLELLK